MILSDQYILRKIIREKIVYVKDGEKAVDFSLQLGPSSFDLRLNKEFIIFDSHTVTVIDPRNKKQNINNHSKKIIADPKIGFVVHPGEFMLGSTVEYLKIPNNMIARLEGRSSYGRLGLMIHATAGYIDPGFEGQITLEFQNVGKHPIILYPYDRICQVVFETMISDAVVPYNKKLDNKYMKQLGTVESRIFKEKR